MGPKNLHKIPFAFEKNKSYNQDDLNDQEYIIKRKCCRLCKHFGYYIDRLLYMGVCKKYEYHINDFAISCIGMSNEACRILIGTQNICDVFSLHPKYYLKVD